MDIVDWKKTSCENSNMLNLYIFIRLFVKVKKRWDIRKRKKISAVFPTSNILVSIIRHSLIPCSLSWWALSRQASFSFVQFFLAQIGHESWGTSVYDDGPGEPSNKAPKKQSSENNTINERKRIKNWKKPMQTSLVQANLAVHLSINHHIYHSCTGPSGVG